jgi:uncharacterized protein
MQRFKEPDVVRGLALFGICVVNVPFMALPFQQVIERQSGFDGVVQFVVEWLFQGKFFLLFSFLFGWGFALQMKSKTAGSNPRSRYFRRLAGLLVIGILHATLVFFGDILVLYAILGIPLFFVFRLSLRQLIKVAMSFLLVAFILMFILGIVLSDLATPNALVDNSNGYLGSFIDAVRARVQDLPSTFSFNLVFNGPLAFSAFCVGLAAARCNFFEHGNSYYQAVRSRIWILLPLGLVGNLLFASGFGGIISDPILGSIAFASISFFGPCLSTVYLVGAIEISRNKRFQKGTVAAGRMSLTCYVLEGILAGLVFNGYGFGLYGSFGAAACFAIAAGIFLCTHLFAHVYLQHYAMGPLEQVLRRFTYSKHG